MKKKLQLSDIVLWVLLAVTFVLTILFFAAEPVEYALSTQGTIMASPHIDTYLYWTYAVLGVGIGSLVIFALVTVARDFQKNPKSALGSIAAIAVFVLLFVVCYFISPATEYNKIVNGENVHYSESMMKTIDMWIYSIYVLLGAPVLLIVVFGLKNLIKK